MNEYNKGVCFSPQEGIINKTCKLDTKRNYMQAEKVISGNTAEDIWQQIGSDLNNGEILEYSVIIEHQARNILLDIDIDLGGGFESGYSTTLLRAPLQAETGFRFAIHKEGFLDDVGKFFGMQDVEIGYPDFDKALIIKTNDESKVKAVFSDAQARDVFVTLDNFTLEIMHHSTPDSERKEAFLELNIEEGITDTSRLRKIYDAFLATLLLCEGRVG